MKALIEAIIDGERERSMEEAEQLLEQGFTIQEIVRDGLTQALRILGPRCTAADFNLLEIMLAGRAMLYVMDKVIQPQLPEGTILFENQPTIIIGTIQGDIHDLGRHVASMVLTSAGYRVVDLGKDVDPEVLVSRCQDENAPAIGISSLITATVSNIRYVKKICQEKGLNVLVVAGGAAVAQASKEYLNVDYVAKDAFDGLNYFLQQVPIHGS